ncbi:MAG: hypothetical protein FJ167_01755 [Gammaproteobacteria bacterium]|nr:hypothetical protein [Gammaproteobacteria bacterium]
MIDGALAWISWVAQWIGQFIPKWEVLDPTLGWVKFRRGRLHSSGRGGIIVWWPILTKVEVMSVAEQTLKLEPLSLTTTDGKDVTVRGVIVYDYTNVELMNTTVVDPDDSVRDKALMVIAHCVSQRTKQVLLDDVVAKRLDAEMRKRAQLLLKPYGVRVLRLGLVELTGARPYRVIQGGGVDGAAAAILV